MRIIKGLCLSYVLGVSAHLGSAGAQPLDLNVAADDCDAFSQAEMRICLAKAAKASADALKIATSKANEVISKWDEDVKYISAARSKLKESGRAFERYREVQCTWSVAIGGGAIGNALEIRHYRCIGELNRARIAQIRNMVDELPIKGE